MPDDIEVLRVLRGQSLIDFSEPLPPQGVESGQSRRYDQAISVNAVIQEVIQHTFDRHRQIALVVDRLAWHTERWLRAAIDTGAHDRALIRPGTQWPWKDTLLG